MKMCSIFQGYVEIMLSDLSAEKQAEVREVLGDGFNYDVLPVAEVHLN